MNTLFIDLKGSIKERNQNSLGKKGYGLAVMSNSGIQVPMGFVIQNDFYNLLQKDYFKAKKLLYKKILNLQKYNSYPNYWKISIRSSPIVSLPGILQTINNIDPLVPLYDYVFKDEKESHHLKLGLEELFHKEVSKVLSKDKDAIDLIIKIINEINDNWIRLTNSSEFNLPHEFRDLNLPIIIQNNIPTLGNIHACNGVIFTKNPINGNAEICAEIDFEGMGNVVDGKVSMSNLNSLQALPILLRNEISKTALIIENLFKFPQDIEFSFDGNQLFILQSRNLIFNNDVNLKLIKDKTTPFEIKTKLLQIIASKGIDNTSKRVTKLYKNPLIAEGTPISSGLSSGKVVNDISQISEQNKPILVLKKPYRGLSAIVMRISGLITQDGGVTSHVAIMMRALRKPYVSNVEIDKLTGLEKSQLITLDGNNGRIYEGKVFNTEHTEVSSSSEKEYHRFLIDFLRKYEVFKHNDLNSLEDSLRSRHIWPKNIGLQILRLFKINVVKYYSRIPNKNIFKGYSIRTSFDFNKINNNLSLKYIFELPSKFNVGYAEISSEVKNIINQFQDKFKEKPLILIHETHKIKYSGNFEINFLKNSIICEFWGGYDKNLKPVFSKTFSLDFGEYFINSLPIEVPLLLLKLPFRHYCLEYVVLKDDKILFTELNFIN